MDRDTYDKSCPLSHASCRHCLSRSALPGFSGRHEKKTPKIPAKFVGYVAKKLDIRQPCAISSRVKLEKFPVPDGNTVDTNACAPQASRLLQPFDPGQSRTLDNRTFCFIGPNSLSQNLCAVNCVD